MNKRQAADIHGLPTTLGRLLKALNATASTYESYWGGGKTGHIELLSYGEMEPVCKWLLTRTDGSEATLDDQSQETKDTLHNLLCDHA